MNNEHRTLGERDHESEKDSEYVNRPGGKDNGIVDAIVKQYASQGIRVMEDVANAQATAAAAAMVHLGTTLTAATCTESECACPSAATGTTLAIGDDVNSTTTSGAASATACTKKSPFQSDVVSQVMIQAQAQAQTQAQAQAQAQAQGVLVDEQQDGTMNRHNVRAPSLPGAYAISPSTSTAETDASSAGSGEGAASDDPTEFAATMTPTLAYTNSSRTASLNLHLSSMTSSASTSTDDVIAVMVEEGSFHGDLQQAQPVPRGNATMTRASTAWSSKDVSSQEGWISKSTCFTAMGVVVFVGVMLTAVFISKDSSASTVGLQGDDSASDSSSTDIANMTNTPAPSTRLQGQILDVLLQNETKEEIIESFMVSLEDIASPQSQALQWLMEDPRVLEHLPWRMRQRYALATFYHATNGSAWKFTDNWLAYDNHECSWWSRPDFTFFVPNLPAPSYPERDGIPCDNDGIFQHLWLWDNALDGSLPEQLYWLSDLRSISLFLNPQLTGTLSTSIGALTKLEGLTTAKNVLITGTLPTQLSLLHDTLHYMSVFGGDLHGKVPSELGLLTRMEAFILDQNRFTGTLPLEVVSNWDKLRLLYAANNLFSGTLPTEITSLVALEKASLGYNQFTGPIPSEIGLLPSLLYIGMAGNALTGMLPTELGVSKLAVLELQQNSLSGPVPSEIGALRNLTHLFLQENRLTGILPMELLELVEAAYDGTAAATSLKMLDLSSNLLVPDQSIQHDGTVQEAQLCWTNSTFQESLECSAQYPPPSCACDCNC